MRDQQVGLETAYWFLSFAALLAMAAYFRYKDRQTFKGLKK